MTVTCDEFLASVKRLITAPATQGLLENTDILGLATDLMRDTIVPMVTSVNEDYFVTKGTPIPILADVSSYRIPSRAIARKLREIKIVDASGGTSDFPKISIDRVHRYSSSGSPFGFHFLGDRVELVPTPQSTDGSSILLYYPTQPGKLVPLASAAVVTGVSGDDVTFSSLPAAFTTGVSIDLIEGVSGNWYLGLQMPITNVAGNTVSFAAGTVSTDLAAGDYMALTGFSPVLQIPDEGAPLLQALTAHDMLYAISDFEGQDRLQKKIDDQKKNFLKVISPRIDGEPTIIINDRSLLRGRRSSRMWPGRFSE